MQDTICTAALRTTAGSQVLSSYTPSYDATCVAKLRAAGIAIVGKANCDEFAMGSTTETSSFLVSQADLSDPKLALPNGFSVHPILFVLQDFGKGSAENSESLGYRAGTRRIVRWLCSLCGSQAVRCCPWQRYRCYKPQLLCRILTDVSKQ